jgi:hypothetical protein
MSSTLELSQLIHRRRQILVQLRDIGQAQTTYIESGDTATLLRLLSVKQRVLAGLQANERELAPFQNDDPESRAWNSQLDRDNCAQEADLCRELLEEVLELERRQEQLLLERRNQAAAELRHVQAARDATGAYRANRYTIDPANAPKTLHLLAPHAIPLDLSSEA